MRNPCEILVAVTDHTVIATGGLGGRARIRFVPEDPVKKGELAV
jgi:hypothetical protein